MTSIHTIIPAGGAGTRLWPLSRRAFPKFLLDLTDSGSTLLQATEARLRAVSASITVVTGRHHAAEVARQCPETEVIAEPSPKDSMAAIGLAAAVLHRRHGQCVVGSFAADHAIRDTAVFHDAVARAASAAESGFVTTIGISPTEPSTAYGYIRTGEALQEGVLRAEEFREKPDAVTAGRYLSDGGYLWNAGMFVMRSDLLLAALAELQPELHAGLTEIAAAWGEPHERAVVDAVWPALPALVIDRAIAEPLAERGRVATVPADMGWTDIGDFAALADLAPRSADVEVDAPETFSVAGRPVVVVGVPGAVVVEMDDVIMVTTREHAQNVKDAVERIGDDLR